MDEAGDPVFGGMTRIPTVMGMPQSVFAGLLILLVLGVTAILFVGVPWFLALVHVVVVVVLMMWARVMCERDPLVFRYLALWLVTTLPLMATRAYWGGNCSLPPNPLRKR